MAKAEMMEMAIFPMATPSAMIRLLVSVIVTAVAVVLAKHTLPWLGLTWQTEAIAYALGIATGAVCNYFGHKSFSFRQA